VSPPTSLVVLSGLSGAGKSAALDSLEDLGYYCVDNLPPALMETFADLCERTGSVDRAALVIDARTHGLLEEFAAAYEGLSGRYDAAELVFLDADDAVLQQRFSETRRPHPMAIDGDVPAGIQRERERLTAVRAQASRVIDTSSFSPHDLRAFIFKSYGGGTDEQVIIRVLSFAFRSGLPKNADVVFDVRFLPNPNYVTDLKPLTGMDKPVWQYVESRPETQEFLGHIEALLRFLIPQLGSEGRAYLTIAFGCTGGRHRSVAIASRVARDLENMGHDVSLIHRDLPSGPEMPAATEEAR
jgi:UPF0042 nucleotide-binding protein